MAEEEPVVDRSWVKTFISHTSDFVGHVGNNEEVELLIWEFEISTNSHYIKQRKKNSYGENPDFKQPMEKLTIRWCDTQGNAHPPLDYDGIPYSIMGTQSLICHQGKKLSSSVTKKTANIKKHTDEHDAHNYSLTSNKKKRLQTTKKVGCEATIYVRHIIKFPEYKCVSGSKKEKELLSIQLKEDLKTKTVLKEQQFHIQLPECHTKPHLQGQIAGAVLPIDKALSSYIQEKVFEESIYSSKEMQVLLREFVMNSFKQKGKPLPPRTNTRFWPTLSQIRNHMASAVMRCRDSAMDQAILQTMVRTWENEHPEDNFMLRLKANASEYVSTDDNDDILNNIRTGNQNFLYIHQTGWQKELLHRYGQELVLLDATYRTCKYAIPLFFVAIPTNVNYIVVAYFFVEIENTASIEEALNILRGWNKDWCPKFFITDYCEKEIAAVESAFADCGTYVYLCDFHRLQAWNRWITASIHGIDSQRKAPLLALMKSIAESYTEEEMNASLMVLMEQPEWQTNKAFCNWFQSNYLNNKKRWVKFYRKERFNAINTTNGVERQNATLKHGYLWSVGYKKNETISQLAHIMISRYLPDCLRGYLRENAKASSCARQYDTQIPIFLHDRPTRFVTHVMKRWAEVIELKVDEITDGVFFVESASNPGLRYEVLLDNGNGQPSCQCEDWRRHHYPCKHILSIIAAEDNAVSWESLPQSYRNSPFLTLDLTRNIETNNTSVPFEDQIHTDQDDQATDHEPSKDANIQKLQRSLRETCRTIEGLSFLCCDTGMLQTCHDLLDKIRIDIQGSCPTDHGLLKEPNVSVPIVARHGNLKQRKGLKKSYKRLSKVNIPAKKRVLMSVRALKRPPKVRKGKEAQNNKEQESSVQIEGDSDVQITAAVGENQDHVDEEVCERNSPLKELKEKIAGFLMTIDTVGYDTLIKEGHASLILKSDMTAKLLRCVIQTYTANPREETDLMNVLLSLSPPDASHDVKMRVAAIVVEKLVCKGDILIPRDVDPRVKQAEVEKMIKERIQTALSGVSKKGNEKQVTRKKEIDPAVLKFKKRKLAELELQSGVYPAVGLQNPGKTNICFANATLQCLRVTEIHRLLQGHLHCRVPSCFVCELKRFIEEGLDTALPMLTQVKGIWNEFQLGEQQDSHEFYRKIMQEVHSCIMRRGTNSMEELFYGKLKCIVACNSCGHQSIIDEVFSDITVHINEVTTINAAIKKYFSTEELQDYSCRMCHKQGPAQKFSTIDSVPKNLVIHINRFTANGRKLCKKVDLAMELDLEEYVTPGKIIDHRATLFGVVYHCGRAASSGHYFAYVKFGQDWFILDDLQIKSVTEHAVQGCPNQSYLLFFRTF